MAIKHNNQIQKNHFRKDWQRRVRCHFDQAPQKIRRRSARSAKAAALAPRPVDKLRPIVRCPTIKYNRRVRAGRGFSLAELKAAGIPKLYAPTIGIAVDHRRQNLSEESLAANAGKPKSGDSKETDVKNIVASSAAALPIVPYSAAVTEIKKSDMPKQIEGGAYVKLRQVRAEKRNQGAREKRAKDKAEAEANKK
ncbi:60S ribosomal protein L13 [Apiospora saccharicola]